MVEINEAEWNNKKKNKKKWEQPQRPLGLYQEYEHLNLGHFRTRTQKEMAWENTWGDNSRKIPPTGKKIATQV